MMHLPPVNAEDGILAAAAAVSAAALALHDGARRSTALLCAAVPLVACVLSAGLPGGEEARILLLSLGTAFALTFVLAVFRVEATGPAARDLTQLATCARSIFLAAGVAAYASAAWRSVGPKLFLTAAVAAQSCTAASLALDRVVGPGSVWGSGVAPLVAAAAGRVAYGPTWATERGWMVVAALALAWPVVQSVDGPARRGEEGGRMEGRGAMREAAAVAARTTLVALAFLGTIARLLPAN
ncbi:hypothetical protein T484DRAFT_1968612 [Baffinella frigidus]|nr:hypothetical protein T484DRAFT_1968612 [Cryptophyta sp. CCMP2293]